MAGTGEHLYLVGDIIHIRGFLPLSDVKRELQAAFIRESGEDTNLAITACDPAMYILLNGGAYSRQGIKSPLAWEQIYDRLLPPLQTQVSIHGCISVPASDLYDTFGITPLGGEKLNPKTNIFVMSPEFRRKMRYDLREKGQGVSFTYRTPVPLHTDTSLDPEKGDISPMTSRVFETAGDFQIGLGNLIDLEITRLAIDQRRDHLPRLRGDTLAKTCIAQATLPTQLLDKIN